MIHQYHLENETDVARIETGDVCHLTPSESGSDPGEKSDDSGYKSSFGRSRSESHSMNAKYKLSRSRTWQDNVEYKRTAVDSNLCKFDNLKDFTFDKVLCHKDQSDNDSDLVCEEVRRKISCHKHYPNPDRKMSLQNVKQVKSYIFNSVRTFVICLSLLQLFQVMGSG